MQVELYLGLSFQKYTAAIIDPRMLLSTLLPNGSYR